MSAKLKNKIITFNKNEFGTDYGLGDIHGGFDLVYESLKNVNFNENQDRLFCVGDLIDRGMFSTHIIDFLKLPFVHAIRGNHEDMLLDFYEKNPNETDKEFFNAGYHNGMSWFLENDIDKRAEILDILSELPLVIEINSERGLIGLVHADIPRNIHWEDFKTEILNGNEKIIETALWGRARLLNEIIEDIPGLGRLYVGHTVQNNVKKFGNVVALDTGAVFNQHLSMLNVNCVSQAIIAPKKPIKNILNINDETKSPFGKIKF